MVGLSVTCGIEAEPPPSGDRRQHKPKWRSLRGHRIEVDVVPGIAHRRSNRWIDRTVTQLRGSNRGGERLGQQR